MEQIAGRDGRGVAMAWEAAGVPAAGVRLLREILEGCFEWNTFLFIPEDDSSVLTELASDSMAMAFADAWIVPGNAPISGGSRMSFRELVQGANLGTLARRLAQLPGRPGEGTRDVG